MIKPVRSFSAVSFMLLLTCCIHTSAEKDDTNLKDLAIQKLKEHATALKEYARKQKSSTELGILVDMSIPSDKKRIFLVNLETDSIYVSGLCAHGQCDDYTREDVKFSNVPGSNC